MKHVFAVITTQDWGTSSWCPNCGFYPTIDADGVKDDSWKAAMPVEEEELPEGNLFAQLPAWFWILMGGIVAIVMTGFYIRIQADEAESTRGMIALAILPFALGTMAVAHIIASRHAMRHEPTHSICRCDHFLVHCLAAFDHSAS